jgi:hypothetical protein
MTPSRSVQRGAQATGANPKERQHFNIFDATIESALAIPDKQGSVSGAAKGSGLRPVCAICNHHNLGNVVDRFLRGRTASVFKEHTKDDAQTRRQCKRAAS